MIINQKGTVRPQDDKTHIHHKIILPKEVSSLVGSFEYTPLVCGDFDVHLTLTVVGPNGFMGCAHRHGGVKELVIGGETPTPGFNKGALPAGEYDISVSVNASADEGDVIYSLVLDERNFTSVPKALLPGHSTGQSRWYKGEMHTHTTHSDGSLTPEELTLLGRERGLDFLVMTDHNTMSGWETLEDDHGLLVIPGVEFTTFWGHILACGLRERIDWRTESIEDDINLLIAEVRKSGAFITVAHPCCLGGKYCTGCDWTYTNFDFNLADAIEVWNGAWQCTDCYNPVGLEYWQEKRKDFPRLKALCACDVHSAYEWRSGTPATYVYAEELTEEALLRGMRKGDIFLSSEPLLTVMERDSEKGNKIRIGYDRSPGGVLRFFAGDKILSEEKIPIGKGELFVDCKEKGAYHIEIRDDHGNLLLMANPQMF